MKYHTIVMYVTVEAQDVHDARIAADALQTHLLDAQDVATVVSVGFDEPVLEEDDEQCPTCAAKPGDGLTDGCNDPDGCGYWRAQR